MGFDDEYMYMQSFISQKEKMPHGALSRAVKQMSRADALACIGASDLRRILESQGLMALIKVEHILKFLKTASLLRILPRKAVDSVISHFDLSVSTEQIMKIILAGNGGGDQRLLQEHLQVRRQNHLNISLKFKQFPRILDNFACRIETTLLKSEWFGCHFQEDVGALQYH